MGGAILHESVDEIREELDLVWLNQKPKNMDLICENCDETSKHVDSTGETLDKQQTWFYASKNSTVIFFT